MEKHFEIIPYKDGFVVVKNILLAIVLLFISSCSDDYGSVYSGQIKHIPWSNTIVIGTDSYIVIVDRAGGQILNTIKRNK